MNTYKAGCFIGVSIVTMNQALAGCLQKKPQAAGARFFELAFDQHKPTEAAEKVLGNHYIQHNPNHVNGAEAFAVDFEKYLKEHPNYHVRFAQVFADGDIVILHSEHQAEENNLGRAIIYLQAVPEAR